MIRNPEKLYYLAIATLFHPSDTVLTILYVQYSTIIRSPVLLYYYINTGVLIQYYYLLLLDINRYSGGLF